MEILYYSNFLTQVISEISKFYMKIHVRQLVLLSQKIEAIKGVKIWKVYFKWIWLIIERENGFCFIEKLKIWIPH